MVIDGEGGALVPGMYEMHGHLGQDNALLNIAAGVTSVRDMGNQNAVLEDLMERINTGLLAGAAYHSLVSLSRARVLFQLHRVKTVATLEEALEMVRWLWLTRFPPD